MTSFDYLTQRQQSLREHKRFRNLVARQLDGVHVIDPDGRRLLNFGANDYLGLGMEMRGNEGRQDGQSLGNADLDSRVTGGSGASALLSGWTTCHERLSNQIAELEETEAAILFPTGFAACSGAVSALAEAGDLILSDELNHASLIDGCRLSRAECVVYPHRDWQKADHILQRRRQEFARVWIVTNTVFGMDGDLAPVDHLQEVAEKHDASVIADEAHGTGVLGNDGSGLCDALGVKNRIAIRIGTLSKAVGSQGGFVAAPRVVVDHLVNHCRSLIYSTSLAPAAVTASLAGIGEIRTRPERRRRVQKLARHVRSELSIAVANDLEASVPIIPVVVGTDPRVIEVSAQLAKSGFYVPAIRPPTVPEGTARLRISLSAAHETKMVDELLFAIRNLM
ncbi:MAG: 8-amino-7-oxononanoate synthase [Rhodopirellula sp.]|nr:8-amino-7-oxononanoate synthase [Rhodopirellula sp.]OUX50898.1 MAG: 8-amino-7-oxononanoate synthase [Rhodopirellula sp. TMED283]